MSLSTAGVWAVGVWDQTVWADGVWREGSFVSNVANKIVSIYTTTAVPNTVDYRHGTAYSDDGALYVCPVPASLSDVNYIRGIAHRDDGALCVTTTGPVVVTRGGWGLNAVGVVVISGEEADIYHNGIPRLHTGEVCMTDIS